MFDALIVFGQYKMSLGKIQKQAFKNGIQFYEKDLNGSI
jgi:hypothetical protein